MTMSTPANIAQALKRGEGLINAGRFADAAGIFREILVAAPNEVGAMVGLGLALFRIGDHAAAETALRACLQRAPMVTGASLVLGTLLGQNGRFTEAETVMRAATQSAPKNGHVWQVLGNSLHRQGRLEEADAAYRQALTLMPNETSLWDQLGDVLLKRGDAPAAEAAFRKAMALEARAPAPVTNLGRIQEERGDLDAAIALHDQAIALNPSFAFAYLNRGNARRFKNDFAGAIADFDAALRLAPDMPEARGCRGYTRLTIGDFANGWPDYAFRIAGQPGAFAPADATGWQGEELSGKRVIVWTEYGLGDEILAASLLPDLSQAAAHCTVLCEPRLVALLQRSFPRVSVKPHTATDLGAFDFKFALADAARYLRPDFASFPPRQAFLTPDPQRVAAIKARLPQGGNIGISWRSGSPSTGAFKSMRLADWQPIMSMPGVHFHSLQYGDTAAEIAGTEVMTDPTVDPLTDLDGFAAQVAAMDLVISVSNTTVHFAGGLGKPVWTLVPYGHGAHWYWFRDRADSPWYPTMKLFRQAAPGQWAPALADAAAALKAWTA